MAMKHVIESRQLAQNILLGQTLKKVVIVGPCSIHNTKEALEYALKLKSLSLKVQDHLFIVMRVFLEKPRTKNDWRGFLYDPHLNGSLNLQEGLKISTALLEELVKLDIPVATEFIDPLIAHLIKDKITWGFIGARTTRSPVHRQLASFLPMPIGFKNTLDGDLEATKAAISVANSSHCALINDDLYRLRFETSMGNPLAHLVLRGTLEGPNYTKALDLRDPLLIDCAHGNSSKTLEGMVKAFYESIKLSLEFDHIKGVMLESFLNEGNQGLCQSLKPGVSVTDPCLSFENTEKLILDYYKLVSQSQGSSSVSTASSLISISSSDT